MHRAVSHGADMPDAYATIADLHDFVVPHRDRPDVAFYMGAAREAGRP